MGQFRLLPATITPVKIIRAVQNSNRFKWLSTKEQARLASVLISVGSVNGGDALSQSGGDDDLDCEALFDLYENLVSTFQSQFDKWFQCSQGGPTSPTSTPQQAPTPSGDSPWPGVPDELLGNSTYGACGSEWDDLQGTLQQMESLEFGLRGTACYE